MGSPLRCHEIIGPPLHGQAERPVIIPTVFAMLVYFMQRKSSKARQKLYPKLCNTGRSCRSLNSDTAFFFWGGGEGGGGIEL